MRTQLAAAVLAYAYLASASFTGQSGSSGGYLSTPLAARAPLMRHAELTHARVPSRAHATPRLARRRACPCAMVGRDGAVIGRQIGSETRLRQALKSLLRVGLPTVVVTLAGFYNFDNISLYICSFLDAGTLRVLMFDDAQFIQNFLTATDLLLAILAGNIYDALYRQQEAVYFALYREVSEAKSLVEQLVLLGRGRAFYPAALACMQAYVRDDLRRLDVAPQQKVLRLMADDPLERILLLTSVGVPSALYDTLGDLRQARSERLGALQIKFPTLGVGLLYLLAAFELIAFPLIGAGSSAEYGALESLLDLTYEAGEAAAPQLLPVDVGVEGVLSVQAFLFACLCGCFVLVLRIIQELRLASGGVFNVDDTLRQMTAGLEDELDMRLDAATAQQQRAGATSGEGETEAV
eukprot:5708843-Prymnesium_polylepis.1